MQPNLEAGDRLDLREQDLRTRARDKKALVRPLARGELDLSTARQRARAVQSVS